MAPNPASKASEQLIANLGVKIGCTKLVGLLLLLFSRIPLPGEEVAGGEEGEMGVKAEKGLSLSIEEKEPLLEEVGEGISGKSGKGPVGKKPDGDVIPVGDKQFVLT